MPPNRTFQNVGQVVSNHRHIRLIQIFLVVVAVATFVWLIVTHVSQRQIRSINADTEVLEKPSVKPMLERQDYATCQNQWEHEHKSYLHSLKQEILEHTEKPIFPWVSPPRALPGPYDPMYYPLPAPSFRYKTSGSLAANIEGRHSASYTRHIPQSGTPLDGPVLYGTMTHSTNGWRRSHWNVTGG